MSESARARPVFALYEPLHIAEHVDGVGPPGQYDALIGGLHTSPALITHDGAQSGIQIRLNIMAP